AWGYHRQGSCQAGFGTTLTQNGNRLYVGAVGSYYWQGQVFYQDLLNRQESLSTNEGPQADDMSYLGYSLTSGDFTGDGIEDVAVGMPRGNHLRGQVVVMDDRLNVVYNITGEQLGSYFGYSLASCDLDGDQLIDIVVGAPWTTVGDAHVYEEGAVYVYTHTKQHNHRLSSILRGQTSREHYGLSIVCLGDMNKDGFQDLAIGAPYGGKDRKDGAVYIYLGSKGGLDSSTPAQILLSETVTQGRVPTFGWSLAGGLDLDDNEYPDLVIGGYEGDAAIVIPTRPVVKAAVTLKYRSEGGIVQLDKLGCSLQDGTEVACVSLQYCITYTGYHVPPTLLMVASLTLDTQAEISPRMFFLLRERQSEHNTTVQLRKEVENCTTIYTYITSDVQDKLTPLVAEVRTTIHPSMNILPTGLPPPPILDPYTSTHTHRTSIYIKNNCGVDNLCVPDLSLDVHARQAEYVTGSLENLELEATVQNRGEDAFQSRVWFSVPQGSTFSKYEVLGNTRTDVTPFCSIASNIDTRPEMQVVCEVGNPLPQHSKVTILLSFQPLPQLLHNISALEFYVSATSASEESEGDARDNRVAVALPVTSRSVVDIRGISWPDGPFDYNISKYTPLSPPSTTTNPPTANSMGPEVVHIYEVTNLGPSPLEEVWIYLLWPSKTLDGQLLLYLLEKPIVVAEREEEVVCFGAQDDDINVLGLRIDEPPTTSPAHNHIEAEGNHQPSSFLVREKRSEKEEGERKRMRKRGERIEWREVEEERERWTRTKKETEENEERKKKDAKELEERRKRRDTDRLREEEEDRLGREEKEGPRREEKNRIGREEKEGLRIRRDTDKLEGEEEDGPGRDDKTGPGRETEDGIWGCGASQCTRVSCRTSLSRQGDKVVITTRSILWVHTLQKLDMPEVKISSRLVVLGRRDNQTWTGSVTSVVRVGLPESQRSLKWLVVAASILAGLLLLALLSALLWAMGFFKRKRPREGIEHEPLNSNKDYNGKS
ncbi:hypothetical protein Pcinc_012561, partial [Petrolisthes cinctipes]